MTLMKVVGVPQTLATFAATAIAGHAAADAYAESLAKSIAELARSYAPVGDEEHPGPHLFETIHAEGNRVLVDAPYGGFVEYGAPGNNTPAQPYLRPAADEVSHTSAFAAAAAILRRGIGSRISSFLGRAA